MGRFIAILLLLALILIETYTVIALRGDDSTSAVVKLLGPGKTPKQCENRIRPHFERIESAMTKIAEDLLDSVDYSEVKPAFGEDDKFLVTDSATEYVVMKGAEDVVFDPQLFHLLKDAGYYAPFMFREADGEVFAPITAACGVPLYQWIRMRLGLGWSEDSERLAVALTGFRYNRNGFKGVDPCPASISDPDPVVFCQIRLNENWLWQLQYYDYDQLQSIQNQTDSRSGR